MDFYRVIDVIDLFGLVHITKAFGKKPEHTEETHNDLQKDPCPI